jgi:hypothetical protein
MDPESNLEEIRSLTREILRVWDDCPEEGEFTQEQTESLTHDALRLAELFDALDVWLTGRLGRAALAEELLPLCEEAVRLLPHAHDLAVDASPQSEAYGPGEEVPSQYLSLQNRLEALLARARPS